MSNYSIIGMLLILIGTALTYWGNHKDAIESGNALTRLVESDSLSKIKDERIKTLEDDVTPYIERRKYRIIKACQDIRQSIYFASFYPKDHPNPYPEEGFPQQVDLMNMLKEIRWNSEVPVRLVTDTGKSWPFFFNEKMEETKSAIRDIHQKSTIVNSNLIKVISEIEDCEFYSFIPKILELEKRENMALKKGVNYQHEPNDITLFHEDLFKYFTLIKAFEEEFIEFPSAPNARKYPKE